MKKKTLSKIRQILQRYQFDVDDFRSHKVKCAHLCSGDPHSYPEALVFNLRVNHSYDELESFIKKLEASDDGEGSVWYSLSGYIWLTDGNLYYNNGDRWEYVNAKISQFLY